MKTEQQQEKIYLFGKEQHRIFFAVFCLLLNKSDTGFIFKKRRRKKLWKKYGMQ